MQMPNTRIHLHSLFGSPIDGRTFSSEKYWLGFNGQEKDDEVAGAGNTNTAMFWEYDIRLGRRWNSETWVKYYKENCKDAGYKHNGHNRNDISGKVADEFGKSINSVPIFDVNGIIK